MRRWKFGDLPTCLFYTSHRDKVGGGELYAHQIAECLDGMTNMRYYGGHIPVEFRKNHFFDHRFKHTGIHSKSAIFVSCSHFHIPQPTGTTRNILLVLFPNKDHKKLVSGYDTIICCSNFSSDWVKKYWGRSSTTIHPHIDFQRYEVSKEGGDNYKHKILSVGRFFQEQNGHSKNQDILIEAFYELLQKDSKFRLTLAGSCMSDNDHLFLDICMDAAEHRGISDKIEFKINPSVYELVRLYKSHSIYWHGNGYKSNDPYETEHFGIVYAEAMASGCYPIPYAGGGWKDFDLGCWVGFDDLIIQTISLSRRTDEQLEIDKTAISEIAYTKFHKNEMKKRLEKLLFY